MDVKVLLEDEKSKTLVTWPGRCSSIVLLFEKYYEIFLEFLRETSLVKSRRISEAYAGLPGRYTYDNNQFVLEQRVCAYFLFVEFKVIGFCIAVMFLGSVLLNVLYLHDSMSGLSNYEDTEDLGVCKSSKYRSRKSFYLILHILSMSIF